MSRRFEPRSRKLKIVVSGGLGDCLLTTPFIRFFRRSGHYDHITCFVPATARELFLLNPHIDRLVACSNAELMFWAIDEQEEDVFCPYFRTEMQKPTGSRLHLGCRHYLKPNQGRLSRVDQLAKYFGIGLTDKWLEVHGCEQADARAREKLPDDPPKPRVLVCPAGSREKDNYPIALWRQVVTALQDRVSLYSTHPTGSRLAGVVNLFPRQDLLDFVALVKRMDAVMCMDSFPNHLAAALRVPAVVLFGPSNPDVFGHDSGRNLRDRRCPPCMDTDAYDRCHDRACLHRLAPERVAAALLQHILCLRFRGAS